MEQEKGGHIERALSTLLPLDKLADLHEKFPVPMSAPVMSALRSVHALQSEKPNLKAILAQNVFATLIGSGDALALFMPIASFAYALQTSMPDDQLCGALLALVTTPVAYLWYTDEKAKRWQNYGIIYDEKNYEQYRLEKK